MTLLLQAVGPNRVLRNKFIAYFDNEVGPEVFQSSVQKTCYLLEFQTGRTGSKHGQWPALCTFSILPTGRFFERWTEHPISLSSSSDCVIIIRIAFDKRAVGSKAKLT